MPCLHYLITILLFSAPISAEARDRIEGPVSARILKVQDGDTLIVLAKIWPGHEIKARVRIRGIDAPELKARCPEESEKAVAAKRLLKSLVSHGHIKLGKITQGKYYGRVLADVRDKDGNSLVPTMLESKLVRPYAGRKRRSWCNAKSALLQ